MKFPDNIIYVNSGGIDAGAWVLSGDQIERNGKILFLKELVTCTVVSDKHETHQTFVGRIAGGILGAAILGPIGAAGGLLTGGKTRIDETVILCLLADGRSFSATVSQLTSAKLQQLSQRNAITYGQSQSQAPSSLSDTVIGIDCASDSVECPMCAETIKAKAKICRYCGFKLHEEEEKILLSLYADPSIETVVYLDEQIKKYRSTVYAVSEISDGEIISILQCFSRLIQEHPESSYRELAEKVKSELNVPYKTTINDIIREGFKFIRKCPPFEIVGKFVVIKKQISIGDTKV
jgi:hypothetical protein